MQEQVKSQGLQQIAMLDIVARGMSLQRGEAVKTAISHALLLGSAFLILVIGVRTVSDFWPAVAAFQRSAVSDGFMVAMLLAAIWVLISNARQSRATADYEFELLRIEVEDLRRELEDRG